MNGSEYCHHGYVYIQRSRDVFFCSHNLKVKISIS
jgi:hypothetical protein